VAGLALRQAFTTALPVGRPLVVTPVKTALSHHDPQRFAPVLLHEHCWPGTHRSPSRTRKPAPGVHGAGFRATWANVVNVSAQRIQRDHLAGNRGLQ
jgi:hypothetical protein